MTYDPLDYWGKTAIRLQEENMRLKEEIVLLNIKVIKDDSKMREL